MSQCTNRFNALSFPLQISDHSISLHRRSHWGLEMRNSAKVCYSFSLWKFCQSISEYMQVWQILHHFSVWLTVLLIFSRRLQPDHGRCVCEKMRWSACVCVCVWVCMFLCRYKKENPIFEQHIPVCLRWALSFKVYILGGLSCDILSSVNQFLCQGAVNLIQSKYVFFCGLSDGLRRTEPNSPPLF